MGQVNRSSFTQVPFLTLSLTSLIQCSFLLSILEGMLYSGSLYLALNMEYSIPGCLRVVHGELSLARLEH